MSDDPLGGQYEAYPYPPRDPRDEARRLIAGSPSHLLEVNHSVFAGRRDFRGPFRALVAGGGTGDAAIMLAQQLADAGGPGEVIYADLSRAARAIVEARARARQLDNIRFVTVSILELPEAGLGVFDYIDCCGVLHHLEDPAAGLAALARVLAPDGGLGVMVYGELGRTGVYHVQTMMRALAPGDPPGERVNLARRLLRQLPETNWFRRNPLVGDHLEAGDAGLYDLLLHGRDRAYRVPEIARLIEAAGLRLSAFATPVRYDPATYLTDARLLDRLGTLPEMARAGFAELLAGNIRKHVFYLVHAANAGPTVADPNDRAAVPHLWQATPAEAARLKPGAPLAATVDGLRLRLPLPPLAGAIAGRCDGTRTIGAITDELAALNPRLGADAVAAQVAATVTAFNGLGMAFLAHPAAG